MTCGRHRKWAHPRASHRCAGVTLRVLINISWLALQQPSRDLEQEYEKPACKDGGLVAQQEPGFSVTLGSSWTGLDHALAGLFVRSTIPACSVCVSLVLSYGPNLNISVNADTQFVSGRPVQLPFPLAWFSVLLLHMHRLSLTPAWITMVTSIRSPCLS